MAQSGPSDSEYLPGLHGLRAIAVTLVIVYHFGVDWVPGDRGVLIFFVLSGFLITRLLLLEHSRQGRVSIAGFYARRALRIFPAFYCYWLLVVGLLVVSGKTVPWAHALSSLVYVTDYYNALRGDPNTPFSHIWSLAIEEQFYLVWPLVFLVLVRKPRAFVLVLVGVIGAVWVRRFVLTFLTPVDEGYIYAAFDTRIDHILLGCLLAIVSAQAWSRALLEHLVRKTYFPLITLAILVGATVTDEWLGRATGARVVYRDVAGFALEPLVIALFIFQVVKLGNRSPWSWLEWPVLRFVGRLSYSLYLYQQLALWSVSSRLAAQSPIVQFVVATGATAALAAGSYYLVERPFLRMRNGKRWSLTGPAQAPHRQASVSEVPG